MAKTGWLSALGWALGLAVISLISNITSMAQLSGEDNVVLAIRLVVSKLVNSGTVWAGLAVLAGWLVRRPVPAMAAAVICCEFALAAHYTLGMLIGIMDADIWASNSHWFSSAAIFGAPLGLAGALAHRTDVLGLIARLVVPLGAVSEPFVLAMFVSFPGIQWPQQLSSAVVGGLLLAGGVILGVFGCKSWSKQRSRRSSAGQLPS